MTGTGPDAGSRGTVFVEDAPVIAVQAFDGRQFVLRLAAPRAAATAVAGSFAHIRCDDGIPMRRPLSIMRADREAGWIEVLFKVVGDGLQSLGQRQVGDTVSVMAPIGRGFAPLPGRPNTLLIGGGVGIPPMVFLAETLRAAPAEWSPLVLMGSELPFPFDPVRSAIACDWTDSRVDRAMPLLEEWGIPSRLASLSGFDGCYAGYVTGLAAQWLDSQSAAEQNKTALYSCGPTPMLEAVAALARRYELPCQVSLEEYMACAIGGCAGCTVLVNDPDGPAMKRVCVDGPVFDAARVFTA